MFTTRTLCSLQIIQELFQSLIQGKIEFRISQYSGDVFWKLAWHNVDYPNNIQDETRYSIKSRLEATDFFNSVVHSVCSLLDNYTDFDSGTQYRANDYLSTLISQRYTVTEALMEDTTQPHLEKKTTTNTLYLHKRLLRHWKDVENWK